VTLTDRKKQTDTYFNGDLAVGVVAASDVNIEA
jgi:hypothetical protein